MLKKVTLLKKSVEVKEMQHFQILFKEVKTTETGSVKIKGFASTPDIDRYNDIINPSAFANAMTTYMKNPRVLLGHDCEKPIGSVVEYNISAKGLEVTVEIVNDVDNCMEMIQNKTLTAFSIGWLCLDCVYREDGTKVIREVNALDLAEISVVAIPANPSTLFTLAKSLKKMFDNMEKKDNEAEIVEEKPEEVAEETTEVVEETKDAEEVTDEEKPTESEEVQVETPDDVVETTKEVVETTEDAPEETSEVVKADEEPEEPKGLTDMEVKALLDTLIGEAVAKANAPLTSQITELKNVLENLQTGQNALEKDFLKVGIKTGTAQIERKNIVVTDSMVLGTIGR